METNTQPEAATSTKSELIEPSGTKPVNHEEAGLYAALHCDDSNLARCYLELRDLLSEGLNFSKILVATENQASVYGWVKKVRNTLTRT